MCLIAGGSAVCFLIDALQLVVKSTEPCAPLVVLFTCSDAGLFEFAESTFENILLLNKHSNVKVSLNLTDQGDPRLKRTNLIKFQHLKDSKTTPLPRPQLDAAQKEINYGRIDFAKSIPNGSVVYLQGSPGLLKVPVS